ncbi:MAG: protein translocase subunit SecD [Actinomycetota bacterium]
MGAKERYVLFLGIALMVAVIALYFIYPVNKSIKLGLDLQGGVSVLLQAKQTAKAPVTPESMDQAEKIIRDRVDRLGVAEPGILRQGSNYIVVQLPGIKDPQRALDVIGKTALLEFRQVLASEGKTGRQLGPVTKTPSPDKEVVVLDKDGETKYKLGPTLMTGRALSDARVDFDRFGVARVDITLTTEGSKTFDDVAVKLYKKQLAIVLDDRVQSAPTIQSTRYGGKAEITGKFTTDEAKNLALVLQTGALPVKLEMSEVRTVGPTLGKDSLQAGLLAGIIGIILVAIFLLAYYRGLGVVSVLALTIFGTILFGIVAVFGLYGTPVGLYWNLTLPGLAGIILSFVSAADSGIVLFERLKEEIAEGKVLRVAVDSAFDHAFRTVLDADLVTLVTAFILYVLAVGPVRGFAFTLMIGVFVDLFVLYFFTHSALGLMAYSPLAKRPFLLGLKEARTGAI